jgi:hypothetical protein
MTTTAEALPVPRRYESGILKWLTTTDHKMIGVIGMHSAFFVSIVVCIVAAAISMIRGKEDRRGQQSHVPNNRWRCALAGRIAAGLAGFDLVNFLCRLDECVAGCFERRPMARSH